jgi:HD superfamily phosphodiesterase
MIEKIEAKARQRLAQNDAAHDYLHASRVANLAKRINEHEKVGY